MNSEITISMMRTCNAVLLLLFFFFFAKLGTYNGA